MIPSETLTEPSVAVTAHTDIVNGNDGSGDGTPGNPYQTIQGAIDNHTWASAGGNALLIADTGVNVIPAMISLAGVTVSVENPFVFSGWNVDGTIEIETDLGPVYGFEVDGNGNQYIFNNVSSPTGISWNRGKFYNTTVYLFNAAIGWVFTSCNFSGAGSTLYMTSGTTGVHYYNCVFDGTGAPNSQDAINALTSAFIVGCTIRNATGAGIRMAGSGCCLADVLIHNCAERAVDAIITDYSLIRNCTIDDCPIGIDVSVNTESFCVENTIITNCSTGVNVIAGGVIQSFGPNGFFGNSNDVQESGIIVIDRGRVFETTDPYVDRGLGNYNLRRKSPFVGASYRPYEDLGAFSASNQALATHSI